jgi:hypothetical protein
LGANWFSSTSPDQLQEIMAGGLKIDNEVSQLVQAMATYSSNNSAFNPTSSGAVMPSNSTLQSAIAAAWHSWPIFRRRSASRPMQCLQVPASLRSALAARGSTYALIENRSKAVKV